MPLLLLVIALFLVVPILARADCDAQVAYRIANAVFKVEVTTRDNLPASGSGVLIADDRIVTNCHVVRGARRVEVISGARRWDARIIGRDVDHDLCLLDVAGVEGIPVTAGGGDQLRVGDRVHAAGFPQESGYTLSDGRVEALHRYDHAQVIQTSAPFGPGASGGGLFDAEGRLVGILTFKSPGSSGFYFAIPTEWLDHLTLEYPAGPARVSREAFWERDRRTQPNFLRAVTLEIERDWSGLLTFAKRWAEAESHNPQCWIAAARAYLHLNKTRDAAEAMSRAQSLDPSSTAPRHPLFAGLAAD